MSEPGLEIRDLFVDRAGATVLKIDHLAVDRGDVLTVVGPNGAGKSTLLYCLARLLRPQRGTIALNGRLQRAESDLVYRRRIALVLQDPLLFDRTVFDNVATGLRFRRRPPAEIAAQVDRWLDRLGILALRSRRATELSGGEAQRVTLARAFVLEPELLLLDEPFSALDPPTRRRLVTELSDLLAETTTTTVLVTHDLPEAAQLGHKMAIILGGALRWLGAPGELAMAGSDADVRAFTQT